MTITKKTTKDEIMGMEMDCFYRHNLYECDEQLTDDEDVVLKFIQTSCSEFSYASDDLKRDREFVKRAIQIHVACFLYVDDELRKDKKFIMELIRISNTIILHYAHHTVQLGAWEHLKQPAIDYLKNELEKEAKKND